MSTARIPPNLPGTTGQVADAFEAPAATGRPIERLRASVRDLQGLLNGLQGPIGELSQGRIPPRQQVTNVMKQMNDLLQLVMKQMNDLMQL